MLSNRQCYTLALVTLVITSSFVTGIEAGRKTSSRKSGGGGGSSSRSKPKTQTHTPNQSHVALSYPTYNAAPARQPVASAPKAPSAPAAAPAPGWNTHAAAPAAPPNTNVNSRPIGWNVNNNNQQGGIQKATATQNNNAPPAYSPYPQQGGNHAPPPYSAGHPNGPPPAYSPQHPPPPQYGAAGHPPPAYTPNGHGYPQQPGGYNPAMGAGAGGYGQPNYHPQGGGYGGYPQQPQGGGFGGGYGGYTQGGGGFGGGGHGQPPVINNYYQQKSGGGLGLTNALLLGVGGIALYGALKPGETKVVYVNNSTNPEDARTVSTNGTHVLVSDNNNAKTVATPLAPFPAHCGQYMNQPVPPQQLEVTTPVPLAPLPEVAKTETVVEVRTVLPENATMVVGGEEVTTAVPLAPLPGEVPLATAAPPAAVVPAPAAVPENNSTVPLIPSECLPFVTGAVLPTNYTGPPVTGFAQAPNPNIQYGNPQWQQWNGGAQQGQVPVDGVQRASTSGGKGVMVQGGMMMMVVVAMMGMLQMRGY